MSSSRSALMSKAQRLAEIVATPLVPSDYLDLLAPLRNPEQLRGKVVAIHPETKDSVSLEIQPGVGWQTPAPGQYVRIGVDVDGVRLWRAYSVTSPVQGPTFTVTVKAIPDGVVSNYLVRRAQPGTLLQLDPPTGEFVLPEPAPQRVLLIAAGSGVTPIMGILRNQAHLLGDVVVVQVAPSQSDAIFRGDLRKLAAAGVLRLIEHHDDVHGLLTPELLAAYVPDLDSRESWACGPTGLLDVLEKMYADRGQPQALHVERFRPSVLVTGDGGQVTFNSGALADVAPGQTLLDAGEEAGVLMPSGCRMGICFGCVVPLKQGVVKDLRDGTLTAANDGDNVMVQTCVSTAAGPCELSV